MNLSFLSFATCSPSLMVRHNADLDILTISCLPSLFRNLVMGDGVELTRFYGHKRRAVQLVLCGAQIPQR